MNFRQMIEALRTGSITRLPHWPVEVHLVMESDALYLFNGSVHEPYTPDDADAASKAWVVMPTNGGTW